MRGVCLWGRVGVHLFYGSSLPPSLSPSSFHLLPFPSILLSPPLSLLSLPIPPYSGDLPDGTNLLEKKDIIQLKRCIYASQVSNPLPRQCGHV